MEGFTLFLGVVMLVFGVLQIMLFFKMWGMTNDMSKMADDTREQTNNIDLLAKHFCREDYIKACGYTLESKSITYVKKDTQVVFSDGVQGEVFVQEYDGYYIILENKDKRFYSCEMSACAALHEYIINKRKLEEGYRTTEKATILVGVTNDK